MKLKSLLLLAILPCFFFSCSDSDSEEAKPKSLELDQSELTLLVGEKTTINVIEAPVATEPVVWSSDNESVATVFLGAVTAVNSGTATITATMGEYTAECVITVPERTYELVWSDEFEGASLNTDNWTIEVNGNGGGNQELQYYTDRPENVRLEDGFLILEARKEEYLGKNYTSGRIVTKNKQDFKYGKIEARFKVPSGRGTWPAFWMLGYGSWPRAGEIDIMEHVGYDPKTFHCALHTLNKNGLNGQNFKAHQTLANNAADEFHTVTMEWVENEFMGFDRIHIYIDGVKTTTFGETKQLQDTGDWPFNDQFFFILNLAIGGKWGGLQGVDDSMFDNPVLYMIDYVKVYQLQ
ncbi:glycosyl hydrolase family protein [Labilibacter sediminis]|nr:glycosyl hydrolase family protein [Labilibacter sediminis]